MSTGDGKAAESGIFERTYPGLLLRTVTSVVLGSHGISRYDVQLLSTQLTLGRKPHSKWRAEYAA